MPQSYREEIISMVPSGIIALHRFVNMTGGQAGYGETARGVTHDGALAGQKAMSVIILGTAIIEAGRAFTPRAYLTSDVDGKAIAVKRDADQAITAIAIEAATGPGELVKVIVVPPAWLVYPP